MVPSQWVFLDAMPLSPNGKLDRRALPEPDAARPDLEGEYVAPRDDVERAMAEVWAEVLGVERVGVDDDFFALGGDSILSLRIVALLKQRGLDLAIEEIFEHKTVGALATAARPLAETPERLLARLDELSDDQVAALLDEMVSSERTTS
jgi:aryl carrier-like protein